MYKLIWSDEFDYEGVPNPNKWSYDIGGYGFGNNERQYYTNNIKNAEVKDGKLFITALKEKYEDNNYTSAKLITYGKATWKYGRIEVSAKLPKGKGSWPAIWMLSDDSKEGVKWPLCGEIDIMEHIGHNEDMIHFSLHSKLQNHIINTQRTYFQKFDNVCSKFYEYAIEWDEDHIEFFVDNVSMACFKKDSNEIESWPFDKNYYLILNIAVGGNWGGAIDESSLPYVMEVDYVRVYQKI